MGAASRKQGSIHIRKSTSKPIIWPSYTNSRPESVLLFEQRYIIAVAGLSCLRSNDMYGRNTQHTKLFTGPYGYPKRKKKNDSTLFLRSNTLLVSWQTSFAPSPIVWRRVRERGGQAREENENTSIEEREHGEHKEGHVIRSARGLILRMAIYVYDHNPRSPTCTVTEPVSVSRPATDRLHQGLSAVSLLER